MNKWCDNQFLALFLSVSMRHSRTRILAWIIPLLSRSAELLDPEYVGRMSLPNSSITCKSCAYFDVEFADCWTGLMVSEDNWEGVRSVGTPPANDVCTDGTLDVTICGPNWPDIEPNTSADSLDICFSSITKSIASQTLYLQSIQLNVHFFNH